MLYNLNIFDRIIIFSRVNFSRISNFLCVNDLFDVSIFFGVNFSAFFITSIFFIKFIFFVFVMLSIFIKIEFSKFISFLFLITTISFASASLRQLFFSRQQSSHQHFQSYFTIIFKSAISVKSIILVVFLFFKFIILLFQCFFASLTNL